MPTPMNHKELSVKANFICKEIKTKIQEFKKKLAETRTYPEIKRRFNTACKQVELSNNINQK